MEKIFAGLLSVDFLFPPLYRHASGNEISDRLHRQVYGSDLIGTLLQSTADQLIVIHLFLILQLMLETCPEIESYGPDLEFDSNAFSRSFQNTKDNMITAIAAILRISDIVFDLKDFKILSAFDPLCRPVNIVRKKGRSLSRLPHRGLL